MRADAALHRVQPSLRGFVLVVVAAGAVAIVHSISLLHTATLTTYVLILSGLTIATGRFAIKIPGRPATVSVSELFVFASILLAGPAIPVLTVALDGLWISLRQKNRRVYRALFNIAEPAISTWAAGHVFFVITGVTPGSPVAPNTAVLVPATVAMAGVFFAFNSGLSAIAVALENGTSAYQVWRSHAWYLAVNYDAAASLATLAVTTQSNINFGVVGLAAPLLILSYVAYREASVRADESRRHVEDVERLYRASVEMLAIAVDAKDQVTHGHIRRVQRHTLAVARGLGVTDPRELKAIEAGALLHDIGKLAVPDYVLNKPSALTTAEFDVMKKHATMGARILTAVDFPYPVVPIVRHHHEQWDGRGYPDGLVGSEIPLGARILAVVDCFDALTSDRPYRPKLSEADAIALLRARSSTFYDPVVLDKFIELIPQLRHDDEASGDGQGAPASIVAGLARSAGPGVRDNEPFENDIVPALTVPAAARERIDAHMKRIAGTEACLFAFNTAGDLLVPAYATARVRSGFAAVHVPMGCGVSGWVAANRSTIRRAEAVLDIGGLATQFDLNICTSVPLFVRGEVLGVLSVYANDLANPEETVAAIGLLAQEVGLVIAKNAWSPPRPLRATTMSIAAVS